MRCEKCQGAIRTETATDLLSGIAILQVVCMNCGRRHSNEKPRPMTAADTARS